LLFTLGNVIQDGLKMEKPRAFHLSGLPDGHAAEVFLARAFVELRTAEAAVKLHPLLGRSNPDGKAVGLVVK